MGWLVTFGILFLLAVLPLGVRVNYDDHGPLVKVIIGPIKFTVYPLPKKEKKKKPEKKQETKEEKQEETLPKPPQPPKQEKPKEKKQGGSLTDFIPFVKLIFRFLGDFRRKLRLDDLYLRLILASSDPCDLAVNYGKTWAAVGNLLPALEKWFVIKKRDVEVECDFTASETLVIARIDVTITLGRLLSLIAVYAVRALKEYLNFRNKRKGGAAK
ncbi:MAG: DUF2953 domain-containing protein [Oscillospiraceae bacterium]|nr:DUF2953 domain-containing protein [Oscillospiraceae bacterium]